VEGSPPPHKGGQMFEFPFFEWRARAIGDCGCRLLAEKIGRLISVLAPAFCPSIPPYSIVHLHLFEEGIPL
jgi:hypothetical protein